MTLQVSLGLATKAVFEHQAAQKIPELAELMEHLDDTLVLDRVLEIGVQDGGTLWLWSQMASKTAKLVGVDKDVGRCRFTDLSWKTTRPPDSRQSLYLVEQDSHQPEVLSTVEAYFGHLPLDMLFLDGDHSYEGVKRDFEMYSPFVRDGGVAVFHDIVPHATAEQSEVDRFWRELDGDKWETVWPHKVDIAGAVLPMDSCGIGVLHVAR